MIICGLDEVGRGALAGPIVGGAVIINSKSKILRSKLKDSKLLSLKQRNESYRNIIDSGAIIGIEIVSAKLINKYGIGWANIEIFRRLIRKIKADKYIVDGNLCVSVRGSSKKIISVVRADASVPEVMAASIIAKVTRDRLMQKLHFGYLNYGWDTNVGYGTSKHIEGLIKFGVTRHHRSLFVRTALAKNNN